MKTIPMRWGVRQGEVISPRLFTAALEEAFKLLEWKEFGNNINDEYITHLRLSDDIVLMSEFLEDLSITPNDLYEVSRWVGLKMNMNKTKIMPNVHVVPTPISVRDSTLEVVDEYIYDDALAQRSQQMADVLAVAGLIPVHDTVGHSGVYTLLKSEQPDWRSTSTLQKIAAK